MVYNAFDQTSYVDSSFNKQYDAISKDSSRGISKLKGITKKAALFMIGLSMFGNFLYENSRPTILGQVRGGMFTDEGVSKVYLENLSTNSVDTLFFNTKQSKGILPNFVLGSPEAFNGRASYLEDILKPGSVVEVSLYKGNNVYEVKNVVSPVDASLKELDVLADL